MDVLGKAGRRLVAWLSRRRRDDDLREEIETHIALRQQSLIDGGMDPRQAAHEARRAFGNPTVIREESQDMWRLQRLESLLLDVRFGARLLAQTPVFTAVAVLSLGSAIAAAVAVFNVADAVLFRSLPVRAPHELRAFGIEMRAGGATKILGGVPEQSLFDIQRGADFADFFGFRTSDGIMLGGDRLSPRQARVEFASRQYFEVLGVAARHGRLIHEADHRTDGHVAVISERLWRTAFDGDPAVAGRVIHLNGRPVSIVGVARFDGVVADRPADIFVPLALTHAIDPVAAQLPVRLVGRLRPGITTAVAEQKHTALYRVAMPSIGRSFQLRTTLADASRGVSEARSALERPLRLGLLLAGVLILVACANTGALLLARFVARREEFGIRVAIGAGRGRLARQLSVEALLVALLAATGGLFVGWLSAPLLMRLMPQTGTAIAFDLRFDFRLVAFTLALSVSCAAAAVIASLFRLWRSDSAALLSTESRSVVTGSKRLTRVLVAAQVACSLLLGVGAISMARTVANLKHVPLGFDPHRMLVVEVNAAPFAEPKDAAAFHAALHEQISAVPGVERATLSQVGILTLSGTSGTVDIDGFTPAADEDRVSRMFFVGPHYFETLGMPVIAGRALTAHDLAGAEPVTVVNERFASFYFGSPANAIGRVVNRDVRIVGVVSDAHYNTLRDESPRAMFVKYSPMQRLQMSHIIRATGDLPAVMAAVRETVSRHDARLRPKLATGDELLAAALARETFFATIAIVLASLAVALACAGVYAAVAYAVSRRRGELAIRLALGASARDVRRLLLTDPLVTTCVGAAAGVPGAYLVMRSASSLLFDVPAFDPTTVLLSGAVLIGFALLAAAWPARRATRIDPVTALRNS